MPDGDTGTNLATTMRGRRRRAADRAQPPTASLALAALAARRGARRARQLRRDRLPRSCAGSPTRPVRQAAATPRALRAGLRCGAAEAQAAVAEPVEGTILTVAAAAADAVPG